jgi:hypothetical protein
LTAYAFGVPKIADRSRALPARWRVSLAVLAGALALAACSGRGDKATAAPSPTPSPSVSPAIAPAPAPARPAAQPRPRGSLLSGRAGEKDGKVLVVKLDNTRYARPQAGLRDADVIYIEPVEAGLTRIAAVYSTRLPKLVGPVRSARVTDLELLRQYGRVAFGYSGAHSRLLPKIAAAPLYDLSMDHRAPSSYWRVYGGRVAPYNVFTNAEQLIKKAPRAAVARDVGFRFGPAPAGGVLAKSVSLTYQRARVSFTWSTSARRWLWAMDGRPSIAAEGGPLGATTLIVQYVQVTDSGYRDVNGAVTPFARTVGSGTALVLRDGKLWQASWTRPTPSAGTRFTVGGKDLPLAGGQVWVVLADRTKPARVR